MVFNSMRAEKRYPQARTGRRRGPATVGSCSEASRPVQPSPSPLICMSIDRQPDGSQLAPDNPSAGLACRPRTRPPPYAYSASSVAPNARPCPSNRRLSRSGSDFFSFFFSGNIEFECVGRTLIPRPTPTSSAVTVVQRRRDAKIAPRGPANVMETKKQSTPPAGSDRRTEDVVAGLCG